MTKLDAINLILRAAGYLPVSALDSNGASIASEAERTLDQVELDIQQDDWNYNHAVNKTLTPDGQNHITLPAECLWVDSWGPSSNWNVTSIGNRLHDQDGDTDEFDDDIIVEYRLRYEWCCIPLHIRRHIADTAALEFNTQRGNARFAPSLIAKADKSRIKARQKDNDQKDVNTLSGTFARGIRGNRNRSLPGMTNPELEDYA